MLELFHQGGPFMYPILILFILGLAISLERLFTLTKASINTKKLLTRVTKGLQEGGVQSAMDICTKTRGPVASITLAGLLRVEDGIENVEKAISNAGTVEMAFLERGLVWLATIISIAPMLGFTGTVSGMIRSFKDIAAANDISPTIVASGISEALLTTLFGLVVAIIIQIGHNFFVSQVDRLTIDMEESSVDLVDTLISLKQSS